MALDVAQPLIVAQVRFAVAGCIMLFVAHAIGKRKLPTAKQWRQITIYGLLNITIYLGCYVYAMKEVTAGVGALSIAINPVFISFLSVIFLRKKLKVPVILALLLGSAGVFSASLPLLQDASVTLPGLLLLLFSMLSYSVGAIYFSSKNWGDLSILTINGWQTMIGGMLLLPITLTVYDTTANQYNLIFWGTTLWLAIPVSIFAVQLWLWLLRINTIKAGLWLFLCPVFGFALAATILGDRISFYTVVGVLLVMIGLFISQRVKE